MISIDKITALLNIGITFEFDRLIQDLDEYIDLTNKDNANNKNSIQVEMMEFNLENNIKRGIGQVGWGCVEQARLGNVRAVRILPHNEKYGLLKNLDSWIDISRDNDETVMMRVIDCYGGEAIILVYTFGILSNIGATFLDAATNLESINLPEGLSSIEIDAFRDCDSLDVCELKFPSSLSKIGNGAFAISVSNLGLNGNKQLKLPDNLIYLGNRAFANIKRIEEIEIPEGMRSLSSGVFYGCDVKRIVNKSKLTPATISIGLSAVILESGTYERKVNPEYEDKNIKGKLDDILDKQ